MIYLEELTNTRPSKSSNMVASISSKILQLRKESINQSLSDPTTIGHRQEYVDTVDGVMYYDDSRAENVNATWFTFENIVRPVIWIAGGDESQIDIKDLKRAVRKKVKALIFLGNDNSELTKAFQKDVKDIYYSSCLEDAIKTASLLAQEDDIVLFSPACKSSNAYETYNERGNLFAETVKQLKK